MTCIIFESMFLQMGIQGLKTYRRLCDTQKSMSTNKKKHVIGCMSTF